MSDDKTQDPKEGRALVILVASGVTLGTVYKNDWVLDAFLAQGETPAPRKTKLQKASECAARFWKKDTEKHPVSTRTQRLERLERYLAGMNDQVREMARDNVRVLSDEWGDALGYPGDLEAMDAATVRANADRLQEQLREAIQDAPKPQDLQQDPPFEPCNCRYSRILGDLSEAAAAFNDVVKNAFEKRLRSLDAKPDNGSENKPVYVKPGETYRVVVVTGGGATGTGGKKAEQAAPQVPFDPIPHRASIVVPEGAAWAAGGGGSTPIKECNCEACRAQRKMAQLAQGYGWGADALLNEPAQLKTGEQWFTVRGYQDGKLLVVADLLADSAKAAAAQVRAESGFSGVLTVFPCAPGGKAPFGAQQWFNKDNESVPPPAPLASKPKPPQ